MCHGARRRCVGHGHDEETAGHQHAPCLGHGVRRFAQVFENMIGPQHRHAARLQRPCLLEIVRAAQRFESHRRPFLARAEIDAATVDSVLQPALPIRHGRCRLGHELGIATRPEHEIVERHVTLTRREVRALRIAKDMHLQPAPLSRIEQPTDEEHHRLAPTLGQVLLLLPYEHIEIMGMVVLGR
jgi:hypothetical protein